MRYVDEFRGEAGCRALAEAVRRAVTRPWTLMEICGGQTHTIVKSGLDRMLPGEITLVHGPGCPVCVTPVAQIDRACALARRPGTVLVSFGDMLRVPGSGTDLLGVKSEGGDVRMVASPLDALAIAARHPDREVVFFAVGFETTAPAVAVAVLRARDTGLRNLSVLSAHVRVPPAMETILSAPDNTVQGFLAAGHVCTVMGTSEYVPLAERHRIPVVVTGFEPADLLQGILRTVSMLEAGRNGVEIQYARVVRPGGNPEARRVLDRVFRATDRAWRGIGTIPASGLALREEFAEFDAERRFDVAGATAPESPECAAGDVLRGRRKPVECAAYGVRCTPDRPLGAPMVSSEGACAAYWNAGRRA